MLLILSSETCHLWYLPPGMHLYHLKGVEKSGTTDYYATSPTNNNACFLLVGNFVQFFFRDRIAAAYGLGDSSHRVRRGRDPPRRRCQGRRPLVAIIVSVKCKTSASAMCATASGVSPEERSINPAHDGRQLGQCRPGQTDS
jgi:hypothetical protein